MRFTSTLMVVAIGASCIALTSEVQRNRATADTITVTVPGCVIDPNDVIGWWPGDGALTAAIGPDLTGAGTFGPALFGTGFVLGGGSLSADGLEPVATALTVEMWVKPFDAGFTGQTQALLSRWDFPSTDDSARAFELLLDPYSNLIWATDETSTRRPEELRAAAPQLFDGNFHHVAATWDQSQFALYVDGNLIGAKASQGGTLNPASATPFRLGSTAGLGTQLPFHGTIDEPAVTRRALTAAEIEALVGAGPNGKCVFAETRGLVGSGLQFPGDMGGVDPIISAGGRYTLFRTRSSNLLPVVNDPLLQAPGTDYDMFDSYRDDLVLLDTHDTIATADDTLEMVAVDSNELGGGLDSSTASMTPDAGHVAFASISNDLVPGDTLAGRDVFLRDRMAGTTIRVSVRSDGSQPQYHPPSGNNNDSREPSMDASGEVIAFESTNRDLAPEANPVPGDTWQTYDIYVRNLSDPIPADHTTERITVGIGDTKANGSSSAPIVSADGRYVWFSSAASNLVTDDTNGRVDIFVHDRQTGATTRLDVTGGTGQPLNGDAWLADVTPDGRWIAFSSTASNIVANDTNGQSDAFLLDAQTATVRLASPAIAPMSNGPSFAGSVSDDGRYVCFQSQASNLSPGDTNGRVDIFVSNMVTNATQRVSFEMNGDQRNGSSSNPTATADGRSVVYMFQGIGQGDFSVWRSELALP